MGKTNSMTDFSGSASSKVQSQTVVGVPGQDDRQLAMAVLAGAHTTSDQKFDKAKITHVGTAERWMESANRDELPECAS